MLATLLVVIALPHVALAAAPLDPDAIDFTETAELTVKVSDQDGAPVADAHVTPYAMRMVELGGHGFWPRDVLGPPRPTISDAEGVAKVPYPVHVRSGPRVLTPRLVTFSVRHSDFVQTVVHFDLGPEHAAVVLKPGCEVAIGAVDEAGTRVTDFGVLVAGASGAEIWVDDGQGGRRTRSMNDGTWQTMLVKLQDTGPTLFSDVLPLRVRPSQSVRMRQVRLLPGARIQGTLSLNVPRPTRGYVVATSVPIPANSSWSDDSPSLTWHDWAEVRPDGSFELESVPRGGKIQLIAVCEGWISTTTIPEARSQIMGQLFDVGSGDVSVALEMEPTGSLEVSLRTKDGRPFTTGRVASSPNQRYWKGGSTFLGQRFRSENYIHNQLRDPSQHLSIVDEGQQFPFDQPVSETGSVILSGLPLGRNLRVVLIHERFHLDGEGERNEVRFKLDSPQRQKRELTVVEAAVE